ncbi:MAG: RNA polymerase sigma-54 factor [Nitrospiraceae bacterium]|nr:MAG: RNA polymerase sigma-54 factor [Nitrospiraceae bacterium]
MALESRLELKLSQKLVLTPQLQMAIKLLQMPQLELSQTINQELVENPFLEEQSDVSSSEELSHEEKESIEEIPQNADDSELSLEKLAHLPSDDYFEERSSDGRDLGYFTSGNVTHPSYEYFLSSAPDLFDHLIWQLRMSKESEEIREVAELIIGNIDENGYLRISDEELSELSNSGRETVQKAVALVQSFDPPGIAARDVKECLQLQLRSMNMQGTLAESLILNNLDLLAKRKYLQLSREYHVSEEDIHAAVTIIESLDPKPARKFSTSSANYITPDVFIVKADNGYQIILNDEGLPKIRINNYYQRLLNQKGSMPKEERQFLEDKLRSAIWLLKSLDQRNKTIYRVTESILLFQRDFFDRGVNALKPLNLKDIASELSLHESTISRVTSNKYLSCPHGIYSFKYFFSNAIPSDSGELSSTSVKEMIRMIISEEDQSNPLSDMRIVDIFKSKNITIARRTIAKYREELKIPSQSQRRR